MLRGRSADFSEGLRGVACAPKSGQRSAIPPKDVKGGEAAVMGGIGAMDSTIAGRVDADAHCRATLARTTSTLPTQPSLLWILHPFLVPLPAEPIGVGAT